jgi:uncharacterized protein (DUF1501 family)
MKSKPTSVLSRRSFLGQASCAGISALPVLNTLLNLRLASELAAAEPPASDEYRALVCLFLTGGNDSYNMLVPRGAAEHAEYAGVRQDLALPQNQLLALNPVNAVGKQLGLHPGMSELAALFEAGNASFISNVGTLLAPTTKQQFYNNSVPLPLGLFSHSDQIEQWQTSLPQSRNAPGWAGRLAEELSGLNSNQTISMNISLRGNNVWQAGRTAAAYVITPDGAVGPEGYRSDYEFDWGITQIRSAALDSQLAMNYSHVLRNTFATSKRKAVEAFQMFSTATAPDLPAGATFPADNWLAEQLRMVAKTIAGRTALGAKRQTFFVEVDGWDHHDDVLANQGTMLPEISAAVGAFYHALTLLGVQNQVTLFSASDFGRTLTSNGRGSDHAWGGVQFVVGGGVNGRRVFGQYPDMYPANPLDLGRGRLIPTLSVDQYFAELALWLGVSKSNLARVLPNIGNFYSASSSSPPLGFLL